MAGVCERRYSENVMFSCKVWRCLGLKRVMFVLFINLSSSQFQKEYPDIYSRRFPTTESEAQLFADKPKIKPPMLIGIRKSKAFSIRNWITLKTCCIGVYLSVTSMSWLCHGCIRIMWLVCYPLESLLIVIGIPLSSHCWASDKLQLLLCLC